MDVAIVKTDTRNTVVDDADAGDDDDDDGGGRGGGDAYVPSFTHFS